MPHEDALTKSRRYLAEGRLTVWRVDMKHERFPVVAECRGGGMTYRLGFDKTDGWRCSCPARTTCSHLHALMLVTDLSGMP